MLIKVIKLFIDEKVCSICTYGQGGKDLCTITCSIVIQLYNCVLELNDYSLEGLRRAYIS